MSEENVEIVKALFNAYADRDLDAAALTLDPAVEVRPGVVGGPERVVYRGLSGMAQFWVDIASTWAEFRIAPIEFRDFGDRVLVLGRACARGASSGIALDQPAAWLASLRGEKVVRFESFSDPQDALEAAGLSE